MKKLITLFAALTLLWGLCACTAAQTGPGAEASKAPTWQEQYDLGVRYLSEGNYREAILAFTAAIEIDPNQAPAYVGRGDAYVLSGETEENLTAAKTDYEKAIELDETSAEAYLGLADIYIGQGDYEKAREILRCAVNLLGENKRILEKLSEIELIDFPKTERIEQGTMSDGTIRYAVVDYDKTGRVVSYTSFVDDLKWQRNEYYYNDFGELEHYIWVVYPEYDGHSQISELFYENGQLVKGLETEEYNSIVTSRETRVQYSGKIAEIHTQRWSNVEDGGSTTKTLTMLEPGNSVYDIFWWSNGPGDLRINTVVELAKGSTERVQEILYYHPIIHDRIRSIEYTYDGDIRADTRLDRK